MSNKIYTDKEIIVLYLKKKGISRHKFYVNTGLSNGFLDQGKTLGVEKLRLILEKYPDFNVDLLLYRKKSTDIEDLIAAKGLICEPAESYDITKPLSVKVPLLSMSAIKNFGNEDFEIKDSDSNDFYEIPLWKDKKIDFLVAVKGDSMKGLYNNGDIVACSIVSDKKFIQWNRSYVIATENLGILIKRLKKSDDPNSVLAVSENKDYDPFDIPNEEITGIALVQGGFWQE